jgi:hypothetical protein
LDQLPSGLEEAYKAAVDRITTRKNAEHVRIALKTFKWITFAREPLESKALLHALVVNKDTTVIEDKDLPDIEKIVSLCVGLVAVGQDTGKVRFVHETTQRYFQRYFREMQKEDGDEEIARTSLHYLSLLPFFPDGPIRATYFPYGEPRQLDNYSLFPYVSRYWAVHIRDGGLEVELQGVIAETFKNRNLLKLIYRIGRHQFTRTGGYEAPLSSVFSERVGLLHLASMHGLSNLCREILSQSSKIEKL